MRHLNSVLVIHAEGNTYNNPTLKAILDLLKENSTHVDLRYQQSKAPMPDREGVERFPIGRIYKTIKIIIYDKLCSQRIARAMVYFEVIFLYKKKYDLVIAVDRQGLIEASIIKRIRNIPFVFFSFEIFYEKETSSAFKAMEIESAEDLDGWFVQDEIRARCLEEENRLSSKNCFLIPLASQSLGLPSQIRLRDRLCIPQNKKVAMLMGSLADWTMASEIINSVQEWPEEWVLIIHERYGNTLSSVKNVAPEFKNGSSTKIYHSDYASDLVDDMAFILSGIDVGLAFYNPQYDSPYTGDNLANIGLASGKIATFLRYSVPIISNEIGVYSAKAKEYNFGAVADSVGDIRFLLVQEDWERKSVSAKNFFSQHLDFNIYKKNVLRELNRAGGCS